MSCSACIYFRKHGKIIKFLQMANANIPFAMMAAHTNHRKWHTRRHRPFPSVSGLSAATLFARGAHQLAPGMEWMPRRKLPPINGCVMECNSQLQVLFMLPPEIHTARAHSKALGCVNRIIFRFNLPPRPVQPACSRIVQKEWPISGRVSCAFVPSPNGRPLGLLL